MSGCLVWRLGVGVRFVCECQIWRLSVEVRFA